MFHNLKSTVTEISLGLIFAICTTPPTTVNETVCGEGKTLIPFTLLVTCIGISTIILSRIC
jgi:hypothetical protein